MEKIKAKSIFALTDVLHTEVSDLYELLMEDEIEESKVKIDLIRRKLKDLKDNITNKD